MHGLTRMLLLTAALTTAGCSARAGSFCQQHGDCRTGLLCVKPPADGGAAPAFGICEPARHGLGEVCFWSSECDEDLLCSNELGIDTGDQRHGTCQPRAAPDAGAAPPDAGAPPDGPLDAAGDGPADAAADALAGDG